MNGAPAGRTGAESMNTAGELNTLGDPSRPARPTSALEILERALGDEHDEVALAQCNLAALLVEHGEAERALDLARRASATYQHNGDSTRAPMVYALTITGEALLSLQRPTEAIEPLERAVQIAERGEVSLPERVKAMLALADALWAVEHSRARARQRASRLCSYWRPSRARTHSARKASAWFSTHVITAP